MRTGSLGEDADETEGGVHHWVSQVVTCEVVGASMTYAVSGVKWWARGEGMGIDVEDRLRENKRPMENQHNARVDTHRTITHVLLRGRCPVRLGDSGRSCQVQVYHVGTSERPRSRSNAQHLSIPDTQQTSTANKRDRRSRDT